MNEQEIYQKITLIARDIFDDETLVLTPELKATDVNGWDSLSHINFVVSIEAAFKIKFKSAELEELNNTAELVALITKHLATGQ